MSNAGRKGKRRGSAEYAKRDQRTKNKARRIARDAERRKPLPCGHGSRHRSPYDERCRRCFTRAA